MILIVMIPMSAVLLFGGICAETRQKLPTFPE
jgi:hypothetical protein